MGKGEAVLAPSGLLLYSDEYSDSSSTYTVQHTFTESTKHSTVYGNNNNAYEHEIQIKYQLYT